MGEMKMHETFSSENLKGREHLGYLGVNGRIILKCNLKETGYEGATQDKVQWRVLVDTIMELRGP
jgi:hypothetical protein